MMLSALYNVGLNMAAAVILIPVLLYIIAPRLKFSSDVRVIFSEDYQRWRYHIRARSFGVDDLIDVKIHGKIVVKDIKNTGSLTVTNYILPVSFENSLVFPRKITTIRLKFEETSLFDRDRAKTLKKRADLFDIDGNFRIENLYRSHPQTRLQVYVLGHDAITGVKKLYESPKYSLHNFQSGSWSGLNIRR